MESAVEPPECVVCSNPFHSSLAVPLVLTSCGHSICHVCLSKLAVTWLNPISQVEGGSSTQPSMSSISSYQPTSTSSSSSHSNRTGVAVRPSVVVQCPECGKRSRSAMDGCDGFPRNIELLRLIDAMEAVGWTKNTSRQAIPEPQSIHNVLHTAHTNIASERSAEEESRRESSDSGAGKRVADGAVTTRISSGESEGKHQTAARERGPDLPSHEDASAAEDTHATEQPRPSHPGGADGVEGERAERQERAVALEASAADTRRGGTGLTRGEGGEAERDEGEEAMAVRVERRWELSRGEAHRDHVSAMLFAGAAARCAVHPRYSHPECFETPQNPCVDASTARCGNHVSAILVANESLDMLCCPTNGTE